jgi:two-component system, NtrC family, nitrogen regulation sensor histidine kinase NtrY
MIISLANTERPGLWGFFVCIVALAVISIVRVQWTEQIVQRWPVVQADREEVIESMCRREFDVRKQRFLEIAISLAHDSTLFQNLFQNDPVAIQSAFALLESRKVSEDFTYEVSDARGTILCWSGKSVDPSYEDEVRLATGDTIVSLSPSGLYTYLTVGVPAVGKRAYVFVSHPLVVNYPISSRFVRRTGFADNLTALVRTDFRLLTKSEMSDQPNGEYRAVPLTDFGGSPVGAILFARPQLDAVLQEANLTLDRWLGFFVGLATICLAWGVLIWLRKHVWNLLRLFLSVTGLWAVRFIWIAFEFPARIIGGDLFDPSVYSSRFGFGAASSVGETLITVCFFSTMVLLCVRPLCDLLLSREGRAGAFLRGGVAARSLVVLLLNIAILWLTRGFGAVIKSFVIDSTIAYHDPLTMLPSPMVFAMQLNILFLGLAFAAIVLTLSFAVAGIGRTFREEGPKAGLFLMPTLFFVSFVGFQWANSEPIVPWYFSLIILLAGYGVADAFVGRDYKEVRSAFLSWRGITILVTCSSLISLALTDNQIHAKERVQVQAYSQELLRPLDSWLSFVLTDGLRSIVNSFHEQALTTDFQNNNVGNLAFSFWTKTLMSRQGYNSAVAVYDNRNKEVSRFSVGLNAYEQREVLTKVFDNEEESVAVVDRTGPLGASKSYGLWSTIRDEQGQLLGSVALLLSASESTMFGDEENEALRSGQSNILQNVYRPTTISIFDNGRLTATTHEELESQNTVPSRVTEEFDRTSGSFVWTKETIGGKQYESLFARNPGVQGKVVEVGLESIDYQWHIFNFLKLLGAAILALILVSLFYSIRSIRAQRSFRITFRTKLLVAFLLLGFVPLILLSYYNRTFTAETFSESIRKTLASDLDLVSQRILLTVADEEDYLKGINNDFAESVSSDLGVDFTVYRRTEVQANSRPELYEASILDSRLPGSVFADVVLLGKQFVIRDEIIGSVRYAVGYKPLYVHGNFVGVLAVPAPYRQRDIEEDLARRNSYYVAVYAIIIVIIMLVGWGVAQQLSTPVRQLTLAARQVGKGNLDVRVEPRSSDEIGELVRSFDQMVGEIKVSRVNLASAERKLAWSEMAKQVAHEIKNPLTPMKLSIQHLRHAFKDKAKDLPSIVESTTQTIVEQIDALSRIATEFAHFARLPEKRFEKIDINQAVQDCVELFSKIKGIEIRTKFDDHDCHLIADRDELRRVFINILRNSVQAMRKGGVITIRSQRVDNTCRIRFTDSGEGIPEHVLPRVFDPNFSTKTDGTGLGLAISQKIIQELNGTITISSEVGKGTTVEISLPV